jgi:hypothetical protein
VTVALLGLPIASDVASAAGPALRTTGTTDLHHGHTVVVHGTGWPAAARLVLAQCPLGAVRQGRCEELGTARTGAGGRFTTRVAVEAVLDGFAGPVDCRVRSCLLVVTPYVGAALRRTVPLTFDPDDPRPTRPVATLTPSTDLLDGQEVVVASDDVAAHGREVRIVPCALPADTLDDCELDRGVRTTVQGAHLEATVRLAALLDLAGPSAHDCRADACVLALLDLPLAVVELSEVALVPLDLDPDGPLAPAPALVVDPATALVDDQYVAVSGTGFLPGERVGLLQCAGPLPPAGRQPDRCVRLGPTGAAMTDGAGALATEVPVRTVLRTPDGGNTAVDCRRWPCHLVIRHGGPGRQVTHRLRFDPEVAPLDTRLTVTPSTGLRGGAVVTVQGSGFRSSSVAFVAQCPPAGTNSEDCATSRIQVNLGPPDGGAPGVGFTRQFRVRRMLDVPLAGWRDCVRRPCVLLAHPEGEPDPARATLRFVP